MNTLFTKSFANIPTQMHHNINTFEDTVSKSVSEIVE